MSAPIKIKSKNNNRSKNNEPLVTSSPNKKRRPNTPSGIPIVLTETVVTEQPIVEDSATAVDSPMATTPSEPIVEKIYSFKDPNFMHSTKDAASSKRTRVWKNLKQIVAAERSIPWSPDVPTYGSIDAPPSLQPAKKYSDLTGLPAKYTDPHTKIRFASPEEFARIRILPSDLVSGYLTLRRANAPVT